MITDKRPIREDLMPGLKPVERQIFGGKSKRQREVVKRGLSPSAITKKVLVLAIILVAGALTGCRVRAGADHSPGTTGSASSLSQEEKHRLYSAALGASDVPLDTALFKDVCKKIGIFNADGNPNESYMAFVQEHVQWGMRVENNQFRSEINTKQRAQEYVLKHLP
jgi:hypothetical protein